jgi:hypothetical protein
MRRITTVITLLCLQQFVYAAPTVHAHGDRVHDHTFSADRKYHRHGNTPPARFKANKARPQPSNIRIIRNPADRPKHKKYGYYSKDQIKVLWLNSRGRVKLLESLEYTDPSGKKWLAPKGSIVIGASFPLPFQEAFGGPYDGKYVMASVIHDVASYEKKRPWQQVHKAFYHAMLASGVDPEKAELMYTAVYQAGPRWGKGANKRLTESELVQFLSKRGAHSKNTNQIEVIDSNMKAFSGAAIYNREVTKNGQNEHSSGVIVRGNDFYIGAEVNEHGQIVPVFGWTPSGRRE